MLLSAISYCFLKLVSSAYLKSYLLLRLGSFFFANLDFHFILKLLILALFILKTKA
jgi:hypothetical protein